MRVWRMRTGISITVTPSERKKLRSILQNRNAPQKHAWRAEIILSTAESLGGPEVAARAVALTQRPTSRRQSRCR